ncbi:hypothetical protein DXG03_005411 [Asterophora parasitica]|uniref:Cation efflux protein transmembrane domain-containing protein n=1 Tax=Asterophora parasitica TaxID=117018 RepID=A0A9P7KBG3_9AGAR|nr:hypothetical protein DXG03_005411 [Asterophora parasitica]
MSEVRPRRISNAALTYDADATRLKLKCSRVFPCNNCVKKGCSAICPEGSLTTGKGNRFVLANTESLHEKIAQLSNRVRNLEDALAQSHAPHSNYPHPLLSDDLLQIKRPLERERPDHANGTDERSDLNDSIDSMGSLWVLPITAVINNNEEGSEEEDANIHDSPQPSDIPWLNYAFPFSPPVNKTAENVRGSIISLLPPTPAAAKSICDLYFRHAAWMYTPITESDFLTTILQPMYEQEGIYQSSISSHSLAVLCLILAMGSLLDLDLPSHNAESKRYYQLGRAALALDSVLEEQSIAGIQALIGLHRDGNGWNLPPEETKKRRELFYELLTYDSWQSLTFGRPPSLSMLHVDCKQPHDTVTNAAGEVEMSFSAWKHRFASQCLSVVHDQAFGARTPNYKVIQELDKKVRHYYVPPSLLVPGFGGMKLGAEPEQPTIELTMQRYIAFAIKEISLFYLHRGYFAQAMGDCPEDPMGSKYSQSVLAAYTSACTFVGLIESLFKQHPVLTERMWFLFTHVFSCAIVLGSIAVKSQMQLAPSALSHLESAYNLFARVTDKPRTKKILPRLHNLREEALSALTSRDRPTIKREADELSTLGGMTRLVARQSSSSPSYSGSSPASQPASSPPPPPPLSTHDAPRFADAANAAPWQTYSPIQQQQQQQPLLTYMDAPYQMEPVNTQQIEMSMMYGPQVSVETSSNYYAYSAHGHYSNMQFLSSPPEDPSSQPYLSNMAWTNFFTQYIVLALHAAKEWLLDLDAGVFWVLMRVLACGGLGVLVWEGFTGQMAKRKTIEWSVLGMSSLLLFVQQGSLLIALFRLSSTRVILFTHFSTLWMTTLLRCTSVRKSLLVGVAVSISIAADTNFFSANSWSAFTGYCALALHAAASSALDSTMGVLSPSLGATFTIAWTTVGASIFALPLYLFRSVMLGFPTEAALPLLSLAAIPVIAYALLFFAPITAKSLAHLSFTPQYFKMSYPTIVGLSAILGTLAFTQPPCWSDLFVAGFLYAGVFPKDVDAFAVAPRTPTGRLLKSYLKTILSNPESRKIFYFLCLNMCYMLVQMLYGVWTNSLGLISDAIHMAFDCMAIGVGLFASVMATWEPNERFTYGYGRIETLSGFANGIFLILISIFIIFEAIQRLLDPPEMNTSQLLLVSSLGLGVNLFGMFAMDSHSHSHTNAEPSSRSGNSTRDPSPPKRTFKGPAIQIHAVAARAIGEDSVLSPLSAGLTPSYKFVHDEHLSTHHSTGHSHSHSSGHDGRSDNMRGVFLHVMADTLGSVGVIISTLLIQFYGWTGFDPIASLFIAVLIAASVVPLVLDTGKILALDLSDRDATIQQALSELQSIQGLASYTHPRFWPKDSSTVIGSIHIQLAPSASSFDPGGPHSSQRTTYTRLEPVVERVDALLRQKIPGLEELTIQVDG